MRNPLSEVHITRRHANFNGIDMWSADGVIVTPEAGVVEKVYVLAGTCGNGLVLRGESGLKHVLCHFAERSPLIEGQHYPEGSLVGQMGMTGKATGKHLHWETYGSGWRAAWRAAGIPEIYLEAPPVGGDGWPVGGVLAVATILGLLLIGAVL